MKRQLPKLLVFLAVLFLSIPVTVASAQRMPRSSASAPGESTDVDAQLAQGLAAMSNQDYATAMRILAPLAEGGHHEAQALVAHLHQKGLGTAQDLPRAARLFTLSALQGWPDALFSLGQMYYHGQGVPEDLGKAADLFLLTAITGDADGLWATGVCFAYGEGRDEDPIEGCAWLLLAAHQDHPNAKLELDELRPKLGQKDWDTAQDFAEHLSGLIANDGFEPAKMPVVPVPAFMAQEASPRVPPRLVPPATHLEAADAQRLTAQGIAAMREQDYAAAIKILAPVADAGFAEAQSLVAHLHQNGRGTAKDLQQAVRLYTLSSLQGWVPALFTLGQLYYYGEGVPQDQTVGADLFMLTAITGDADGMWAIGVCFGSGEGRKQDPVEACAWLLIAANLGHDPAKQELEQLRPKLGEEDWKFAQEFAEHLSGLITGDGFDPEKMPVVPVPAFMAQEARPQVPPRLSPQTQGPSNPETAPGQERFIAEVKVTGEMAATGDLKGRMQLHLPAELFEAFKREFPNPKVLLRDMVSSRNDREIARDSSARYDDASSSAIIDIHFLGFAHNLGRGRWEWLLEDQFFQGLEQDADGRTQAVFEFKVVDPDEPIGLQGPAHYTLPEGASQIAWDVEESKLTFLLPYTGGQGEGRLATRFAAREKLMSCIYKVYGLETEFAAQWIGKAIFRNEGDGPITDLRVRFKLGSYSELDLWQKYPEVVPGQTVVAVYHPVINKTIAQLTSTTPVNLLCEWRYTDAKGQVHEDSDGGRIAILGRHQFVFSNLTEEESMGTFDDVNSNAELIAAWVSRDDLVVKQFASAANKAAGGEGAPYSDEAAMKVLRAIYEIWQANNFTYQGPVGFADESMSFDNKIVQSMKYPRDVIRDRSATCIELAALYCAMAEAVGLSSNMVLIPGHAYPLIELPSGDLCPVECTGVGGGQRYGTASFDQVVEIAAKNTQKALESGLFVVVNIRSAWLKGVSNPELDPLPADILQRWNVVLDFALNQPSPTRPGPNQPGPVQPGPNQPRPDVPPANASAFLGAWSGEATQPLPTGETIRWPMTFNVTAGAQGTVQGEFYGKATVRGQWGGTQTYEVWESFVGQVQGASLAMKGTSKTNATDGQRYSASPDTMTLTIQSGQLVGNVQLADGGTLTFRARK